VRTVAVEIESQIEDYARAIKDNQLKVKHWADKLRALREAAEQQSRELAATPAAAPAADADAAADGEPLAAPALADLTPEQLEAVDTQELQAEIALTRTLTRTLALTLTLTLTLALALTLTLTLALTLQAEIAQLEEALAAMTPNLGAIAEYRTREAEWRGRLKEFDDVTAERDAQRRAYEALRKRRLDEFMAGFRIIGMRLKEMYQARAATPLARVLPPAAAAAAAASIHPPAPPPFPPPLPPPTSRPRARPPARTASTAPPAPHRQHRTASSRR